jgi:hypothetical protein
MPIEILITIANAALDLFAFTGLLAARRSTKYRIFAHNALVDEGYELSRE